MNISFDFNKAINQIEVQYNIEIQLNINKVEDNLHLIEMIIKIKRNK